MKWLFVLYNAMHIERIILDNKIQYKNEDYKILKEHYELKTKQIELSCIFDSTFYGLGKTNYMLIQSLCIDVKERKYKS